MWSPQNFFRRCIYNPIIFPGEDNGIILYIAATDFVKLMCQVRREKCYNRVVSYFTESPFKCHNSANIYGMNRIALCVYLNMRYIFGINLIAAKGFVSNESDLCQCIIYLFLEYGHYKIVS